MYLGDQPPVVLDATKRNSKDAIKPSKAVPSSSANANKFGCATLPTKLRQMPSLNQAAKVYGPRQSSAPQMNPNVGLMAEKLAAKRQSSAPQISVLPEEFRQVYQKITGGEKVNNVKKDIPCPPALGGVANGNKMPIKAQPEIFVAKPVITKREAFKPASHFQEVRGYESAPPTRLNVNVIT